MGTQPSAGQGNSKHAEPPADVRLNVGSQSGGAGGILEDVIDYRPLLQAAFRGDWNSAESFFQRHPASEVANLTSRSETALHIAALNAQDQFVEKLVGFLSQSPEALKKVDCSGRTALHHGVLCGRIRIIKALVESCRDLTQIEDKEGRVPFNLSTQEASMHKEIAWFLARNMIFEGPTHPDSKPHANSCIISLAYAGHLDIVLYLLEQYPSLILSRGPEETGESILGVLARMQSHFLSGNRLSFLEALIYKSLQYLTTSHWNGANIKVPSIKKIHDMKLRHEAAVGLVRKVCYELSKRNPEEITKFFEEGDMLAQATVKGISEFVKLSIQYFPELISISTNGTTLMTLAVKCRQEGILRLFLKESSTNGFSLVPAPTEIESGRMMLAAAMYNHDFDYVKVSGAAFQMQRELQWFKAVESWVTPDMKTARLVDDDKTYWQMFVEKHHELLKNGQKWVKETADKCMLVATLIATVLFTAAFTVPGTDNNKGIKSPLKGSILVFAISDGLGLICSVTAILLFLAILTSRDEPLDFLDSMPKKIIMGLSCLFLSLAFMLMAFAATLTFVLDNTLKRVAIPIGILTALPVTLFMVLQLPLLLQMVKSTFGPSIFYAEDKWKSGIIIGQDDVINDFEGA